MNRLLVTLVYSFVNGIITWGSILTTYFFIDFNRNYASSSYPGDLTTVQEWMYLIFSTLGLCIGQFIVMILFKKYLKSKREYRILYYILALSVTIFFFSIYFYLFGL